MATQHNFRIKNGLEVGGVLIVNSSGQLQAASISGAITATSLQLGSDAQPTLTGDGTQLKIQTTGGYVAIGPDNSSWMHFSTDRNSFYFNKKITVNEGIVDSYDEDLQLRRAASTTARLRITAGTTISDQALTAPSIGVTNIVTNKVVKFNGTILDDSNITDTGSLITLGSNTTVSGTLASGNITTTGTITSGAITGTTATASGGTNTTALASTAFVQQELTTLIGGAPSTLNDLNELAAAINDDANYNTTLTTALATKLPLAGGSLTGALNTTGRVNLTDNNSISEPYVQLGITNTVSSAGLFLHANSGSGKKYEIQSTADGKLIVYDRTSGAYRLELLANGDLTMAGNIDTAGLLKVGGNDTEYANNYIRFKPTGAAYIDHNTVGQGFYFRTSTSSSLDTTPLTVSNSGIGVPGIIQSGSSAGTVTIIGGSTNQGGKIVLSGGNNTGATGSGIAFYSGASTATPTERMRILSGGNVGIGTTSPAAKLEVGKNEAVSHQVRITSGVWNEPTLNFYSYSNYNYTLGNFGTSGSKKFQLKTNNGSVVLSTSGNDSTNVGIGTSTVLSKLHVAEETAGAGRTDIRISRSVDSSAVNRKFALIMGTNASNLGSTWRMETESSTGYNDNATLNWIHNGGGTDKSPAMSILHGGNVGIGTASPGCALDITRTSGWAEVNLDGAAGGDLILKDNGVNYGEIYAGSGHGMVLKSYASQHMSFLTNADATAKMTIQSGGNVGIGTTSPSATLHINKTNATSTNTGFDGAELLLTGKGWDTNLGGYDHGWKIATPTVGYNSGTGSSNSRLSFTQLAADGGSGSANPSYIERVRIDDTGNLEVRSGAALKVYRDTNAASAQLFMDASEKLYIRNSYANKDLIFDRTGQLFVNGVRNYYQKITLVNSSTYTFDVPIEATGSGHTVYYECMYNHFGNDTYGARRMGFFSFRSLNNPTSADHVVHNGGNSTNAGAWSVSMVGSGTSTPMMRFTKSAGSYSGTGQGYIHVRGGLPV